MPTLSHTPQEDPVNESGREVLKPTSDIIDRLKTDAVFVVEYLDDRAIDESRAFKEGYADRLILEDDINSVLLDPDVSRFRPEAMSESIVYDCASFLWNEPPVGNGMIELSQRIPHKHAAYLRDIARILRKRLNPWPEKLPQVSDDDFEDPFGVGVTYLRSLKKDAFEKSELRAQMSLRGGDSAEALMHTLTSVDDPNSPFRSYIEGKKGGKIGVSVQTLLARYKIAYPDDRTDQGQANIWIRNLNKVGDISLGTKIALFISLRKEIPEKEQETVTAKLLREFLEGSDHCNILSLYALYQSPAGAYFPQALNRYPALMRDFLQLSIKGSPMESAFALCLIARCCEERGAQTILPAMTASLYPHANCLNNERYNSSLNRLLATHLNGDRSAYTMVATALLEDDHLISQIPISLIRNGELDEIRNYLKENSDVFRIFPEDVLDEVLTHRLKDPKNATEELYLELGEAALPSDFDHELAAIEILELTSLPLIEVRHMNLNGILGSPFRVHIMPASPSDSLGSWTLSIQYTGFRGHRFVNETVQVCFKNCELVSEVSPKYQRLMERVGIYCAHQFFVKQKEDQRPEALSHEPQTEDEAPDSVDLPDTTPEITVSDKEERDYQHRKETPLTIDVTTKDAERFIQRRDLIRATLEANKATICRLLRGDFEDADVEKALIHRVMPGSPTHQPVFERVHADDVLEALVENNLAKKNWYFLNSLPHIRKLGFHAWEHTLKPEQESEKEEATEDSAEQPAIWLVTEKKRSTNAEIAYLAYKESGFPDLSDFREVEVWNGIHADAKYEDGHLMEARLEDGTVLASGMTAKSDLNAALALKMNSGEWMKKWLNSQKRVLLEEIQAIQASDLAGPEKEAAILPLQTKISELPGDFVEIMKQSGLIRRAGEDHCRSARFAMGRVMTGTTFNQGNFLPIKKLQGLVGKEDIESLG